MWIKFARYGPKEKKTVWIVPSGVTGGGGGGRVPPETSDREICADLPEKK